MCYETESKSIYEKHGWPTTLHYGKEETAQSVLWNIGKIEEYLNDLRSTYKSMKEHAPCQKGKDCSTCTHLVFNFEDELEYIESHNDQAKWYLDHLIIAIKCGVEPDTIDREEIKKAMEFYGSHVLINAK